jgi:hypothetical protein
VARAHRTFRLSGLIGFIAPQATAGFPFDDPSVSRSYPGRSTSSRVDA